MGLNESKKHTEWTKLNNVSRKLKAKILKNETYTEYSNRVKLFKSFFLDLLGTVLFAASCDEMFIRDKFGESAFGKLLVAELAVPHPLVVCIGSLIATTGAGMQSLTGL